jgi:hypothetical protein
VVYDPVQEIQHFSCISCTEEKIDTNRMREFNHILFYFCEKAVLYSNSEVILVVVNEQRGLATGLEKRAFTVDVGISPSAILKSVK